MLFLAKANNNKQNFIPPAKSWRQLMCRKEAYNSILQKLILKLKPTQIRTEPNFLMLNASIYKKTMWLKTSQHFQ